MLSIVLDTSNQYLGIGIYKDHQMIDSLLEAGSKKQSEYTIPRLQQLLENHHLFLKDADEMIITQGPGSYTGVRVAMTIAKVMHVINGCRIKCVSSLNAYAGLNHMISVIDARSHKVFVGLYDKGKPLMEETLMTIDEARAFIKERNLPVTGETQVLGFEATKCDLVDSIYQLSLSKKPVEHPDLLTPVYIKEVEAKKTCL